MTERAIRWVSVASAAAVGCVLAAVAFAFWLSAGSHFPEWAVRTLVRMVNLETPTVDPDWDLVLLLWGPVNAVLYGVVGLLISQKLIDRIPAAD